MRLEMADKTNPSLTHDAMKLETADKMRQTKQSLCYPTMPNGRSSLSGPGMGNFHSIELRACIHTSMLGVRGGGVHALAMADLLLDLICGV